LPVNFSGAFREDMTDSEGRIAMESVKRFALPVLSLFFLFLFCDTALGDERGPMKPIAPMMIEHRLIDRVLPVVKAVKTDMERTGKADTEAVAAIVDFFRFYGDEVHHGKEEKIYFRELGKKKLSPRHRALMEELIGEHETARKIVGSLAAALDRYKKGDASAFKDMEEALGKLPGLYSEHIRKEDRVLFIPSLEYFSPGEQQELLEEMKDYDEKMIHEKYRETVSDLRAKYQ